MTPYDILPPDNLAPCQRKRPNAIERFDAQYGDDPELLAFVQGCVFGGALILALTIFI